jgi:hypothetical protein
MAKRSMCVGMPDVTFFRPRRVAVNGAPRPPRRRPARCTRPWRRGRVGLFTDRTRLGRHGVAHRM